jgi:hypothetical protein
LLDAIQRWRDIIGQDYKSYKLDKKQSYL